MATLGFSRGSVVENLPAKARDLGSIPGVGKIPWRRAWLPIPVFLPGEFHGQRSLAGCSLWGSQRVRHDWAVMHVVTSLSLLSSSEITWPVPSLFEVIMGKSHSPNNPFTENLLSVGQCAMWKAQNKETLQAVTSSWWWGSSLQWRTWFHSQKAEGTVWLFLVWGDLRGAAPLGERGKVQIYKHQGGTFRCRFRFTCVNHALSRVIFLLYCLHSWWTWRDENTPPFSIHMGAVEITWDLHWKIQAMCKWKCRCLICLWMWCSSLSCKLSSDILEILKTGSL